VYPSSLVIEVAANSFIHPMVLIFSLLLSKTGDYSRKISFYRGIIEIYGRTSFLHFGISNRGAP